MKKIIFSLLIIFSISAAFIFFVYPFLQTHTQENNQDLKEYQTFSEEEVVEETKEKTGEEIVQDKIAKIRKRLALKGLILEGDSYLISGDNTLALQKYLEFYKENPDDTLITDKLGDTYFAMHKYTSALSYYKRNSEISEKYITTLFYTTDFSNVSEVKELISTLNTLDISQEEKFYYATSASCVFDFHECKIAFEEYFWPNERTTTASGSTDQEITFSELKNIKTAIENYNNFQIDDVSLKNAYIIGVWYSDDLLNLAAYLGEKELGERPDYKPLLKIVAQSYFKLGEYKKSRAFLGNYNELDDTDKNVTYMLGVVNSQLKEYLLANIYLEKAIQLGYEKSIEARRAIIYNFFLLDNTENVLKNFRTLIEEHDYTENDLSLALYYHIIYESYDWVEKIAPSIQEKYPENSYVYAYLGWIQREKGNPEKARELLKQGEKIDSDNPFLLLNIAYNEKDIGNTGAALIYFKKTIAVAEGTEFSVQAKQEIENL